MSSDAAAGAGLYIVSAPSGAGKTSLLRALVERRPRLAFSVSYTTREPRSDEIEGRDYHFIAEREFERMRAKGEFLECACVYGNGYGTGAADVQALRAAGRDVVLEIDWQGAREVRSRVPESISVFILPPSRAVLRSRLTRRGTDSEQTITERMTVAAAEIEHWHEYDYVVVNDDFARALAELKAVFSGGGAPFRRSRPELAAYAAALLARN